MKLHEKGKTSNSEWFGVEHYRIFHEMDLFRHVNMENQDRLRKSGFHRFSQVYHGIPHSVPCAPCKHQVRVRRDAFEPFIALI